MFNVTDANDNRPIFVIPSGGYVANVLENATVGCEIITVMATDLDQGIHQSITYSVLSNTTTGMSVPFEIRDPTVSTCVCTYCCSQPVDTLLSVGGYTYIENIVKQLTYVYWPVYTIVIGAFSSEHFMTLSPPPLTSSDWSDHCGWKIGQGADDRVPIGCHSNRLR